VRPSAVNSFSAARMVSKAESQEKRKKKDFESGCKETVLRAQKKSGCEHFPSDHQKRKKVMAPRGTERGRLQIRDLTILVWSVPRCGAAESGAGGSMEKF